MGQESGTTTTTEAQEAAAAQEATAKADAAAAAATEAAKAGGSTTTFDEDYVKELRAEAAKHRVEAKAAQDKLKEREDADLSEAEKAKKEKKESDERADKAEAKLLRAEVAQKKKLSPSMAGRLVGDTKDELEKDADKLLKDIAPTAGAGFDGGARGSAPKASSMNEFIRGSRST